MLIKYLGHACFKIESGDSSVVFDPYQDGSVRGYGDIREKAVQVLCSHGHHDHCGAECVELIPGTEAAVSAVKCFHDDAQGAKRGNNLIHVVEMDGLRVVHMGDIGHELSQEQLEETGRPDVLMIPVGGFYTIDAATAAGIAGKLQPRVIIPMHFRLGGTGLSVISELSEFTALYPEVNYAEETMTVTPEMKGVYVMKAACAL